jgi:hypothetical protein
LETIRQASSDVATAIGVPPEWVGVAVNGSSLTYANRDQRVQDLNVTTTNHYVNIWNYGFSDLIPDPQYVRLNTATLERSDLKTRLEAYALAAQVEAATGNRIYTEGEMREFEDRVPLPPRGDDDVDAITKQAAILQKMYLAVGVVLTTDEARELARQAGIKLSTSYDPALLGAAPQPPLGATT